MPTHTGRQRAREQTQSMRNSNLDVSIHNNNIHRRCLVPCSSPGGWRWPEHHTIDVCLP